MKHLSPHPQIKGCWRANKSVYTTKERKCSEADKHESGNVYYVGQCMYHGSLSLEIKCPLSGVKRLML